MNTKVLFLVFMCWFTHVSVYAMGDRTLLNNEVTAGFTFGYATGLVPVAGQFVFPILLSLGSDSPHGNFGLFAASACAGHAAGVATLVTLCCQLKKRARGAARNFLFGSGPAVDERMGRLESRISQLEAHPGS